MCMKKITLFLLIFCNGTYCNSSVAESNYLFIQEQQQQQTQNNQTLALEAREILTNQSNLNTSAPIVNLDKAKNEVKQNLASIEKKAIGDFFVFCLFIIILRVLWYECLSSLIFCPSFQ
jgi:hypothetical protein